MCSCKSVVNRYVNDHWISVISMWSFNHTKYHKVERHDNRAIQWDVGTHGMSMMRVQLAPNGVLLIYCHIKIPM